MMRKPCPHNPVWAKFQCRHFRRKKARMCAKRLIRWIGVVAEANFFVDPRFAENLFNQAGRIAEAVSK